ncbi:hypothetical protein ASPZODRAFT_127247 [Penicilliopsis zonata CBS 506.65]|uniref:Pseudouridine synthase RsuA/RluA-like domain-containing protein n=1 Tax=Penicilliopsis zonata CBS 506.65 TaxID=1073090 RepID=A0A1L9SVG9_9EURO|nr:hypothetical protein ASPZODRAFT_127247 [Penicilliopsis zonata CBS 506.65]OJJ51220.1 hypothetical protein ASPZODRAFT_127247 [Penicilliopsis zonata CBS 506.65]
MSLVGPIDTTPPREPPKPAEPLPDVLVTPCAPAAAYYFEGGLRRIKPYHFTYNTNCKERWRGRQLVEIFTTEFRDRPPEYYKEALETGRVTVNGKQASPTTTVKNGDVISHTLHRHEPPVSARPIGVIYEDDNLLVIDKPAGVPVHAAGRYHYQSIVEILKAERNHAWQPRPCNRLDRLTSGVMFIGKTPRAADQMAGQLKQRTLQKEYVARVKGKFPDGVIVCDQPILSVSPKLGLNRVRATGKDAKTKFRRVAYYPPTAATDGEAGPLTTESEGYSIVHCLPLTGRTHQIRVHLQFLGHPISNDPIYSNRRVFGPDLGKLDTSAERDSEIIDRLNEVGKSEVAQAPEPVSYRTHLTAAPAVPPGTDPAVVEELVTREHEAATAEYEKRKGEKLSGLVCEICDTPLYTDPAPHELGIYLHALAYSDLNGGWVYRSQIPEWALPPPGMDGLREAPEWVPVPEDEEIVIGGGEIPEELGSDDEGDRPKKRNPVPALVRGFGMVDISADRIYADGSIAPEGQEAAGAI